MSFVERVFSTIFYSIMWGFIGAFAYSVDNPIYQFIFAVWFGVTMVIWVLAIIALMLYFKEKQHDLG